MIPDGPHGSPQSCLCFFLLTSLVATDGFPFLGERLYLGDEEGGTIERLQKEVKAKEETAETLRSRVDEMEKEACKRDREIDILRQSLRILSNKKRGRIGKNQLRDLH